MSKRQKMFAVLPTLLTLGNAASGFGSITFAAKLGPEELGPGQADQHYLLVAALLIFLGMVFDVLDGSAARWAKQTSDFGTQLDSLCDVISFGVAPAFLMLQFSRNGEPSRVLWVIAVLFVLCAVLRLARFNVETDEDDSHNYFSGLPSPAAAGTVASFPIALVGIDNLPATDMYVRLQLSEWLEPAFKMSLPLITLAVACLMISRLRYSHVFNQWLRGRKNRQHLIQVVFALAVVFMLREIAVPLVPFLFCYFAFFTPLRAAWSSVVSRRFNSQRI